MDDATPDKPKDLQGALKAPAPAPGIAAAADSAAVGAAAAQGLAPQGPQSAEEAVAVGVQAAVGAQVRLVIIMPEPPSALSSFYYCIPAALGVLEVDASWSTSFYACIRVHSGDCVACRQLKVVSSGFSSRGVPSRWSARL